ncbi:hypothetical protein B9G69_006455 [Bdellovibrio sp. SKB1291214]|uniref:hypothetical protein n=1 Tax=Bdellovibrio sp. SKB1291214 TaxID=1732569 RepID=UPI001131648D|nr:hypothetical protein [Bdellovibrio sp. SKB1291214]UYL10219.1 hypothetical protein B9G69_006455 [Bdellovibrio sp. SKB1291214]
MKHFAIVFLTLLFSIVTRAAWDLNDVSYVMPLQVQSDGHVNTLPMKGLIPEKIFDRISPIAMDMDARDNARAMRVVAMRIDPCFPYPTQLSCQKQLRLVWQPLVQYEGDGSIDAIDAALHSFYPLTDAEFDSLLQDLQTWKARTGVETRGLPLGPHPAFSSNRGVAALKDLNRIILKFAGERNLSRVTAMFLRGGGAMWLFGAFDFKNGELISITLPRLGKATAQSFVNVVTSGEVFSGGGIAGARATGEDTLSTIVSESQRVRTGNEDLIRKELSAAYKIENPKSYNPENMDCVSCHVAQTARLWVDRKRADIVTKDIAAQFGYQNAAYNMANISQEPWHTQQLRALGYHAKKISIAQRAINESAEVADSINRYLNSK